MPLAEGLNYCLQIIEISKQHAIAYKPNIEYFESFGESGNLALISLINSIPKDIPVLLDCNLNDTNLTAQVSHNNSIYSMIFHSKNLFITLLGICDKIL